MIVLGDNWIVTLHQCSGNTTMFQLVTRAYFYSFFMTSLNVFWNIYVATVVDEYVYVSRLTKLLVREQSQVAGILETLESILFALQADTVRIEHVSEQEIIRNLLKWNAFADDVVWARLVEFRQALSSERKLSYRRLFSLLIIYLVPDAYLPDSQRVRRGYVDQVRFYTQHAVKIQRLYRKHLKPSPLPTVSVY